MTPTLVLGGVLMVTMAKMTTIMIMMITVHIHVVKSFHYFMKQNDIIVVDVGSVEQLGDVVGVIAEKILSALINKVHLEYDDMLLVCVNNLTLKSAVSSCLQVYGLNKSDERLSCRFLD